MLSAGMLAALADSTAALSRRLPFGSPPPCLAATVISRRILEKSLPRCTSALPFLRLICDHRECPDIHFHGGPEMAPKPPILLVLFVSRRQRRLEALHSFDATGATDERGLPAASLGLGARREGPAGPRAQVFAQVHVREIGGAGVPDLAGPRLLGQHLDADLQRPGPHVIETGLERHHPLAPDRRGGSHGVETGRPHGDPRLTA